MISPRVSSAAGPLLVEEVLVVLAGALGGKLETVSHDSVELKTTLWMVSLEEGIHEHTEEFC